MSTVQVRVPDMGDVKGVTVLDVLVKKGDKVAVEDPLISLESDKAAMDVPSPVSGVIASIETKKGDEVSSGTLIVTVETEAANQKTSADQEAPAGQKTAAAATPADKPQPKAAAAAPSEAKAAAPATAPAAATSSAKAPAAAPPEGAVDLVVLGSGVGGYTAAFRAADLGLNVTLI
jgi:dihydrolipoamide dehydrogenase